MVARLVLALSPFLLHSPAHPSRAALVCPVKGRIFFALALVGVASSGRAWSSRHLLLFEPVHQLAIEKVLSGLLSPDDLAIVELQQSIVDRDQKAAQSAEHAMTGIAPNQDVNVERPIFIAASEQFVRDHLGQAIQERQAGPTAAALADFGKALHPLEDATSPPHRGFQTWSDSEGWIAMAKHVNAERSYPVGDSAAEERRALEGVVRYAYDIYLEKIPMPDRFFDAAGNLLLPPAYRTDSP